MTSPDPAEAFRDAGLVRRLAAAIAARDPGRTLRIMHVCGTHENAICRFGLRDLLPPWIRLIAGPGCPVCVCPAAEIDMATRLALDHGVIVASFGDVMRVPARFSLAEAKARGGDCRVVYGVEDAVRLAVENPARDVVFFAVGFETTSCTTAAALRRGVPANFSILPSHRIVPPALEALLASGDSAIDGFLLPGHVTTVAGLADYEALQRRRRVPMAVAGFEPVDILLGILRVLDPADGIFNAYRRSVRPEGNEAARRVTEEVFETCDATWRGLGVIPGSGQRPRAAWAAHDAVRRFGIAPDPSVPDTVPGCRCGQVLLGRVEPEECGLFAERCTPDAPLGPCMVASEGTCQARFRSRRRKAEVRRG